MVSSGNLLSSLWGGCKTKESALNSLCPGALAFPCPPPQLAEARVLRGGHGAGAGRCPVLLPLALTCWGCDASRRDDGHRPLSVHQ